MNSWTDPYSAHQKS